MPNRLVLLVGLPGSGKSTYLEMLGANAISSDDVRHQLADDSTDQSIHARVFFTVRHLVRERLAIGRPVTYVDATNLTPAERAPYIRIARRFDAFVEAWFFDVPVDVCVQRNTGRERVVPEAAIRNMADRLVPPSREEGFDHIEVIWRIE